MRECRVEEVNRELSGGTRAEKARVWHITDAEERKRG